MHNIDYLVTDHLSGIRHILCEGMLLGQEQAAKVIGRMSCRQAVAGCSCNFRLSCCCIRRRRLTGDDDDDEPEVVTETLPGFRAPLGGAQAGADGARGVLVKDILDAEQQLQVTAM